MPFSLFLSHAWPIKRSLWSEQSSGQAWKRNKIEGSGLRSTVWRLFIFYAFFSPPNRDHRPHHFFVISFPLDPAFIILWNDPEERNGKKWDHSPLIYISFPPRPAITFLTSEINLIRWARVKEIGKKRNEGWVNMVRKGVTDGWTCNRESLSEFNRQSNELPTFPFLDF